MQFVSDVISIDTEGSPGQGRGRGGRGRGRAHGKHELLSELRCWILRCTYSTFHCLNLGNGPTEYDDENWDDRGRGYGRGGYGRGRGQGYRGRGRGGYGGQPDYQQESNNYAYNDDVPIPNQGRGKSHLSYNDFEVEIDLKV